MFRAVRGSLAFLVAAIAAGALAAPAAHAVQASGSILLVPSKQTALVQDEVVQLEVYFRNTSTQTPGPGVGQPPIIETAATLTGPITVDLACVDCACTTKDPAALSFVPGAAMGCDVKAAGVTGCTAAPGAVLIDLDPAGIALPADDAPVFLATISVKNNLLNLPPSIIRAGTDICALTACIQPPNVGCASCSAEGCSFLAGQSADQPLLRCKHSCVNQVNFTSGFDAYIFQGVAIVNDPNFDPSAESFTLTLGRPNQAPIINISVPGGIPAVGINNDTWILNGFANQNNPGIDQIKITRQTGVGCQNSFRINVRFFGDLSALAGNTDELLRTVITFDGRPPFANEEVWERLQNGNLRNDIDIISAC